ncbi:CPBP family intramembrane glutamic endopeptidase [Bacillus sp. AK128]
MSRFSGLNEQSIKFICLIFFASMIVVLQINNYLILLTWSLLTYFFFLKADKNIKQFMLTILSLGFGFYLYLYARSHWNLEPSVLERVYLILLIIPLIIVFLFLGRKVSLYWKKPEWNNLIWFPFIWTGFHNTTISKFLMIAISINILSLLPFYMDHLEFIRSALLGILLFSVINATLEEVIWRGLLLKLFSEQVGDKWAVIITSIGFGLQHYSLGFSWISCMFFALGGLFFGGLTVRSNSIFPTIIWHIVLNFLMVSSGLIKL